MNSKFVDKQEIYQESPLGKYLIERQETAIEFSVRCKVSAATIYKAIKGCKISKRVAKKIVTASKKRLSIEDFLL